MKPDDCTIYSANNYYLHHRADRMSNQCAVVFDVSRLDFCMHSVCMDRSSICLVRFEHVFFSRLKYSPFYLTKMPNREEEEEEEEVETDEAIIDVDAENKVKSRFILVQLFHEFIEDPAGTISIHMSIERKTDAIKINSSKIDIH
jgi:hypothetical protein